ncbi:MAG: hypothetical protein JEZ06_02430 [Anaerolineaceae bacterium]|nr:hypothetical protein [Anaerolineaceae bacterium]
MIGLYLIHLNLKDSQEQGDLPGFYACNAPRRTARGRDNDQFMGLLSLNQHTKASADKWMRSAAEEFYSTRGSVTAGLKAAAEHINQEMMKANSRLAREGLQLKGLLNLAVLRGELLYLAHAGPTRSLLFGSEVQCFNEPALSGLGLGTSQKPELSYFQTNIGKRHVLFFCAQASKEISLANFQQPPRLSLEQLRKQILFMAGEELQGQLIQFHPAEKGVIQRLRPNAPGVQGQPESTRSMPIVSSQRKRTPVPSSDLQETSTKQPPESQDSTQRSVSQDVSLKPLPTQSRLSEPEQQSIQNQPPDQTPSASSMEEDFEYELPPFPIPGIAQQRSTNQPPTTEQTNASERRISDSGPLAAQQTEPILQSENEPSRRQLRRKTAASSKPRLTQEELDVQAENRLREQARREEEMLRRKQKQQAERQAREYERKQGLAQTLESFRERLQNIKASLSNFMPRLLPLDSDPDTFQLSPASMLFIAVVVPLVVVVIATSIYMSKGRGEQHAGYVIMAEQSAAAATLAEDPVLQRQKWNEALDWLDTAEEYGSSDESQALRMHSMQALDGLDSIYRLNLKPVLLNSFASSVQISRIAAGISEVYMLDDAQGVTRRLLPKSNGNGFTLDNDFRCGPGMTAMDEVGPLQDMALIPGKHSENADVLGIDSNGTLLYCIPNEAPVSNHLVEPPGGWGLITAIGMHKSYDVLYVLDASNNALFIYYGEDYDYLEAPEKYSNPELSMRDVVDMDVYGDDLYLLHVDGLMTRCTFGVYDLAKTHCEYPARFEDKRPGRQEVVMSFEEAVFAQVATTEGLDPSLYLLDIITPAVYRFSLQLNLHNLLEPQPFSEFKMPDQPATAFAISPSRPDRTVFFAFGNEVFYAPLP